MKYSYKVGKGEYMTRWMISKLEQKRYVGSKLAFARDESLIGMDAQKIIFPIRKEYLANKDNFRHYYMNNNIDDLYIPFESKRVEYAGFWHECHELQFYAKAYLLSAEEQQFDFELITCGSVAIWLNGILLETFSPYTRNTASKCHIKLPLKKIKNELIVSCRDLAERDTHNYFQLKSLNVEEIQLELPIELESKKLEYIETYLEGSHLEKENYFSGDINIIFTRKNIFEFEYSVSSTDQLDLAQNKVTKDKKIFSPGQDHLYIGKVQDYSAGVNKFILTIYINGLGISREFNVEIYPFKQEFKTELSIGERKKEALRFLKKYGKDLLHKAFAFIEDGTLTKTGKKLLFSEMEKINRRMDCSDFRMPALIWFYSQYKELFTDAELRCIEETILNFRYWMDEPGNDVMWFFSENHALAFHTCELLAGELFKQRTFSNSGMTGLEHMEKAKKLLERWFAEFARNGYAEWNSSVYLPIDLISLFAIYELTEDAELKATAKKVADQTFEIIAANNYKGIMVSSHGRVYEKELRARRSVETAALSWIAWGEGYLNRHVFAVMLFAISSYEPPEHLRAISLYKSPKAIEVKNIEGPEKVRLYMYKSNDYSMASALSYKPFHPGHQEHVFQMNIGDGPETQIWINHPGENKINGLGRPSYFAGNGILPKVHQENGRAVIEFNISEEHEVDFTHAYCSLEYFEEYEERGNWLFVKKLNGYMGVYAENGYAITSSGPLSNRELKSPGRQNRWLARVGSEYECGSFSRFIDRILSEADPQK